jgi:flagellar biosynthesis protein FliR
MIELTDVQLQAWMATYFWPFVRIGACFVAAPVFGARFVPVRIRIGLAAALALIAGPMLPTPPAVPLFSVDGLLVTLQQALIGLAIGFSMQLIFDAIGLAGQLLANSMGLSFAFNVDPARGAATPALGQLYLILVTMTFVTLGGHIALIELLLRGFDAVPVATNGLSSTALRALVESASTLFAGALSVALPGVTALLVANLAFGVISRAAPTLNLMAVGFPITLTFGLLVVVLGMPAVQSAFIELLRVAFAALEDMQSSAGSLGR